jgi:regulator of sigma E protease
MMIGWYLVGILALGLLMVVHEGGHYLAARAYGMRVTKFSIGFGPAFFKIVPLGGYYWFTSAGDRIKIRLFRHDMERHGPTVFQVAMIPFFAYVQIAGLNPMEEIDPNDKGSYANASLLGRILTIFGGPAANYLFASVLFFGAFFFGGKPFLSTEVNVLPDRPAKTEARLQDGDRIVEIAGVPVQEWEQMAETISKHPGERIPIIVDRKGERVSTSVTPENDKGRGKIGVSPHGPEKLLPVSAKEASIMALTRPPAVVRDLVLDLGRLLTGKAPPGELSGPVKIVEVTAHAAKSGWTYLLGLLGVLSAYLGAFNLIPFPALDGGRLMFLAYEATTRRRPNAQIEAVIHTFGFITLFILVFYVTFANDLRSK